MNISRINLVNFNGNIQFKCIDEGETDIENAKTVTLNTDDVKIDLESGVGGFKDYHICPDGHYKHVYVPRSESGCVISATKDGSLYKAIYLDGVYGSARRVDYSTYEQWYNDAKESTGAVDCPIDVVFMKMNKGY